MVLYVESLREFATSLNQPCKYWSYTLCITIFNCGLDTSGLFHRYENPRLSKSDLTLDTHGDIAVATSAWNTCESSELSVNKNSAPVFQNALFTLDH